MNAVPSLRFSNFHGDWIATSLGALGKTKSGVGFSTNEQGGESGTPFLKVSDMNLEGNESTITTANHYVTPEQVDRLKLKPFREPTIIFAKVGAAIFLERKRIAQNFLIDNNMMAFIPSKKLDMSFAKVLFERTRLSKFAQVGALPSYNGSDIETIRTRVPNLDEQKKIAHFLAAVNDKIAGLRECERLLTQYKKGAMQKIFAQDIRFKADDGSDFPDWKRKELGEILEYEQPTKYLVSSTEYQDDYELPVLTAGKTFILGYSDETHGVFEDLPVIIFDDFTTANKFVDFPFKAKSSAMKMLKLKSTLNNLRFVYEAMQMIRFPIGEHKRYWISEYQNWPILFPSPDEQQKIANFLSTIDTKITAVSAQITQMQEFKKGLLQQMFV